MGGHVMEGPILLLGKGEQAGFDSRYPGPRQLVHPRAGQECFWIRICQDETGVGREGHFPQGFLGWWQYDHQIEKGRPARSQLHAWRLLLRLDIPAF